MPNELIYALWADGVLGRWIHIVLMFVYMRYQFWRQITYGIRNSAYMRYWTDWDPEQRTELDLDNRLRMDQQIVEIFYYYHRKRLRAVAVAGLLLLMVVVVFLVWRGGRPRH
jgi:hypothetical protein